MIPAHGTCDPAQPSADIKSTDSEPHQSQSDAVSTSQVLDVGHRLKVSSPILFSVSAAILIASVVVAIDTWLASVVGIIRDGLPYDGVGYAIAAKASYLSLTHDGIGILVKGRDILRSFLGQAPAWKALMALHLGVFGDGFWQIYTVRFWPMLVLLLMTIWLGQRYGGREFGLFAGAAAIIFPITSPNAFAVLCQLVTGAYCDGYVYFADLRPDMLYAVLLIAAIMMLVETIGQSHSYALVFCGMIAGLAVLVKSSTLFLTMAAWSVTFVLLGLGRARNAYVLVKQFVLTVDGFLLIVLPWGLAGGFQHTLEYLHYALGPSGKFMYGLHQGGLVGNLTYYLDLFRSQMGLATGLALMALVTLYVVEAHLLRVTDALSNVRVYAILAIILYAIPTITPVKNKFLGLPASFAAWVLLIILAGRLWQRIFAQRARLRWIVGVMALTASVAVLGYSVRAAGGMVPSDLGSNLKAVHQMARDLRRVLSNNDQYVVYWSADFPGVVEFLVTDNTGNRPVQLMRAADWGFQFQDDPTAKQRFVSGVLRAAKAIVMFKDNIEVAEQSIYVPRGGSAVLQAIREYLLDPANQMCEREAYRFVRLPGYDVNGGLTAALYIRCGTAPA
jgi:hypothetical protein